MTTSMYDVSVCIPYHNRRKALESCFAALERQPLDGMNVQIILGTDPKEAMDFRRAIQGRPVLDAPVSGTWSTSKARNSAIRAARGRIILMLDCDVELDRSAAVIRGHCLAHDDSVPRVVLGCVRGYDKLGSASAGPTGYLVADRRESVDFDSAPIPWCLAWTGNLSLPRRLLDEAAELFDETFCGWGMEDQEFAFRLHQRGVRFSFDQRLLGYHRAHPRDVRKNLAEEQANLQRFLRKHPTLEVELVAALGDMGAHQRIVEVRNSLATTMAAPLLLTVQHRAISARSCVFFGYHGALLPPGSVVVSPFRPLGSRIHHVPLLGLRTTLPEKHFDTAFLDGRYRGLAADLVGFLEQEATRIACSFEWC